MNDNLFALDPDSDPRSDAALADAWERRCEDNDAAPCASRSLFVDDEGEGWATCRDCGAAIPPLEICDCALARMAPAA